MAHLSTKEQRTAANTEKPATPKGSSRLPINTVVPSDIDIDFMGDEMMNSDERKKALARQAQQAFPQHQQGANNFTRTAKSIDDIAPVSSIKSTVTTANDIYGENVVLMNVEFKFSTLNNQQIENAWFDAYLEDEPDTDLRVVVNGYMVINQMKTVQANNGFPIVGRFVKNSEKRNRWEFIAPSE